MQASKLNTIIHDKKMYIVNVTLIIQLLWFSTESMTIHSTLLPKKGSNDVSSSYPE
jgi:hypothetical protein